MIRALYILIEGGICIYSKIYDTNSGNPWLVSSFIAAVSEFSREAIGNELRGIESDGRFLFISNHDTIVTVVVADNPDEISSNLIDYISINFLTMFAKELQTENPDVDAFTSFDEMLAKIIPPNLVKDTTIEPGEPLDALSMVNIPSKLRDIALFLVRENGVSSKRVAQEFSISVTSATEKLEKLVETGNVGRKETRDGTLFFV